VSKVCPHCQQPLPEVRLGVRLSATKARIFDAVARAGEDGIERCDLIGIVYGEAGGNLQTLKAHIFQINELIEDEGYHIGGGRGVARLMRGQRS
jgi:hypothetical protein